MINVAMDSQILTGLMSCPRAVENRHQKLRVSKLGKSNALECGTLAHIITEYFNKALIAGKDRNEAVAIALAAGREYINPYAESNIHILDKKHLGLQNTPAESGKYEINGKVKELTGSDYVFLTMEQFFHHTRNDTWTPLHAEHVLQRVIYQDDEIRVLWKAKFDLIADTPVGIISTDYKTMSQQRDPLSLNNQFMGQCVLLNATQVAIRKIGWQKTLKPEVKFHRTLIPYSVDRLSEWINEIVPFYARMYVAYKESGYFPPNFTHCESKYGFCQYRHVCEADRNLRDVLLDMDFIEAEVWDVSND